MDDSSYSDERLESQSLFEKKPSVEEDDPFKSWTNPSRSVKAVGYGCAFLSMFLNSLSLCCAQALGGFVPEFELNFCRFAMQLVVVSPVVILNKYSIQPRYDHLPWLGLLCVSYNVVNFTYYGASVYLPAGTLGCLCPSLAIVLVAGVTCYIARECRLFVAVSVVLCITGMLLITQPEFIFQTNLPNARRTFHYKPVCAVNPVTSVIDADYIPTNLSSIPTTVSNVDHVNSSNKYQPMPVKHWSRGAPVNDTRGYVYVVVAAVVLCIIYIVPGRRLQGSNPFVSMFYIAVSGVVVSSVLSVILEKQTFPRSARCIALLLGHSLTAGLASMCTQVSVIIIPAVIFSLAQSLQLLVLFIAQYTVLSHLNPGHRNAVEVTGTMVVFLGNVTGPLYKLYEDVLII